MKNVNICILAFSLILSAQSCVKLDTFIPKKTTFSYTIHNGESDPSAAYEGDHPTNFSVSVGLLKNEDGTTLMEVTLNNTIAGENYLMSVHNAIEQGATLFNEFPSDNILNETVVGNGESISITKTISIFNNIVGHSYDILIEDYKGYLVVRDPLQEGSITDLSTNLILAPFARERDSSLERALFKYGFNNGQVVEEYAYTGTHPSNLDAEIQLDELANGKSRVSVRINNTRDGQLYHTHVHDVADAASTPNGTPYTEVPNADIFAATITGNGGMTSFTNISDASFRFLTKTYDGFFVVHDPFQDLSTADPTTFVMLGVFAREIEE